MVITAVIFFYGEGKNVYASDSTSETEEKLELTEEQMQQLIQWMQEGEELSTQKVTKEFVVATEDAPEDIITRINQRNVSSEYNVIPFFESYTCYTEVLGVRVDVIKITATGEVYEYEDGKVHLYRMRVDAEALVVADVEVEDVEIMNSDGSVALGRTYVYMDSIMHGEHCFCCTVYVFSKNQTGADEAAVDVSIGQVW